MLFKRTVLFFAMMISATVFLAPPASARGGHHWHQNWSNWNFGFQYQEYYWVQPQQFWVPQQQIIVVPERQENPVNCHWVNPDGSLGTIKHPGPCGDED